MGLMEKTHLKFCYVYTNNASITQDMSFLYINGFILESCHICMESLIICLHRNVKNSKFIKKNTPLKFDQHPPPRGYGNSRRPNSIVCTAGPKYNIQTSRALYAQKKLHEDADQAQVTLNGQTKNDHRRRLKEVNNRPHSNAGQHSNNFTLSYRSVVSCARLATRPCHFFNLPYSW